MDENFRGASSGPCSRGLLLTRQPLYWAELSRHPPKSPEYTITLNLTQIKVTTKKICNVNNFVS